MQGSVVIYHLWYNDNHKRLLRWTSYTHISRIRRRNKSWSENRIKHRGGWSSVLLGNILCTLISRNSNCWWGLFFVPQQYLSIRFHNAAVLLKGLYNLTGCLWSLLVCLGTAPILMAIGVLLFVNVKKLEWGDYRKSFPAFAVVWILFFYLCSN